MSHSQRSQRDDRSRRKVMGFDEFAAGKKGAVRALHKFQQRKQKQFQQKAIQLRTYHKVMHKEGYTAGKGASRKRRSDDNSNSDSARKEETEQPKKDDEEETTAQHEPHAKRQKRHKSDPLAQSLEKQKLRKQERIEHEQEQEERKQQLEVNLRKRRKRNKQLSQRTKRGQPVMKHIIGNLLDKLEKDR